MSGKEREAKALANEREKPTEALKTSTTVAEELEKKLEKLARRREIGPS